MASLKKLTSPKAVLQAIAEYDALGAEQFLKKYGYKKARRYRLLYGGKLYDSKAIIGAAYRYQLGEPLVPSKLEGGKARVVLKLRSLGFKVIDDLLEGETIPLPEEAEVSTLWEGTQQTVVVNKYERSAKARAECIRYHGTSCFVCGFDFAVQYGIEFQGFIHVHHLVPISSHDQLHEVSAKNDLRPVCPNCHAVIHHGGKTRTIEEVKELLQVHRCTTSEASSP